MIFLLFLNIRFAKSFQVLWRGVFSGTDPMFHVSVFASFLGVVASHPSNHKQTTNEQEQVVPPNCIIGSSFHRHSEIHTDLVGLASPCVPWV